MTRRRAIPRDGVTGGLRGSGCRRCLGEDPSVLLMTSARSSLNAGVAMSTFQLDSARRSAARTTAPAFAPLEPPFAPDLNEVLTKWMPPGLNMQALALFRLLVGHADLASRIWPMASGLIAKGLLPERDQELLIGRVT